MPETVCGFQRFTPAILLSDKISRGRIGTGFFITDDGYLIVNEDVVKDAAQVRLVTSAGTISTRVVKVDCANDLGLLKAEGKFSSLPIAASRGLRLGATVATVGFPEQDLIRKPGTQERKNPFLVSWIAYSL